LEGKESKSESIKTPFQEQEKMLFSIWLIITSDLHNTSLFFIFITWTNFRCWGLPMCPYLSFPTAFINFEWNVQGVHLKIFQMSWIFLLKGLLVLFI
jgi:hypothetical protein